MRFSPGDILAGRYRIVALLGRGGMGEVYRADDLTLGQPVALKFLPAAIELDPTRLEQFLNEIRSARQVSHPNVCRVYDVVEVDGRHFLTMEYVDGEDLASLLRRIGRLPQDKALDIARQLCAGLAASHDRGVLHRDLKPANVMLDGLGKVRITDFGLASRVDAQPGAGEIAGTPQYMAPEQLSGGTLSVQSDLYALGLLLYEIFTGKRFYQATSFAELRELHQRPLSALTSSSAELDPVVERVIERCLERDPRKRPSSAIAVAASLPGGDPLAAALAAGETPSPQMVAAAGEEGGLSTKVAIACLAAVLIGSVAYAMLQRPFTIARFITLEHSTDVLGTKAQEMLARIGYPERPADTVSGLVSYPEPIEWIKDHDRSVDRWTRLSTMNPPVVAFWHRTSPRPIEAIGGPFGGSRPTATDPPFTLSGMTYLETDTQGRLIVLEILAPQVESATAPAAAAAPDWSRLFVEAGLDMAAFTPVAPTWVSAGYADARAAWTGPSRFDPAVQLSVQAAAYRGRAVFFRVVAPWTRPERLRASAANTAEMISGIVVLVVFISVCTTAIVLARRNLRLGRGDRRGAWRFAVFVGLSLLLWTLLRSHHIPGGAEVGVVMSAVSSSVFFACLIWLVYIALEPYVRRRWPQALISWTRLLSGRWRDPLVGRDLLLGGVVGVFLNMLYVASALLTAWLGQPLGAPIQPSWLALTGVAGALAQIIGLPTVASIVALMFLFLIFMLRVLLRHELAAAAAFVLLTGGLQIANSNTETLVVEIPLAIVFSSTYVFLLTRLGLLAFVSGMFLGVMSDAFGFGLDFGPTYDTTMILALLVMVAPAAFGFYTSLAGRPMIVGRLLED